MAAHKNRRGIHSRKVEPRIGKGVISDRAVSEEILAVHLRGYIPEYLAKDLVEQFVAIRRDVVTGTLERSTPGKFVETVVQVLQYLERQSFDKAPKVDDYLKNLESRQGNLSDDLRLVVSRVARAIYTLRNKRGIAHKDGVDPNVYDLRYLYASAQWVLSEFVRHALESDMETANQLVEFVQLPVDPLVEDFGDRRLVLSDGTARQEILMLLKHYYPEFVPVSQIHRDMDRRDASTVSNIIRTTRTKRLIEGDKDRGYKLTRTGYREATDLVRINLEKVLQKN